MCTDYRQVCLGILSEPCHIDMLTLLFGLEKCMQDEPYMDYCFDFAHIFFIVPIFSDILNIHGKTIHVRKLKYFGRLIHCYSWDTSDII